MQFLDNVSNAVVEDRSAVKALNVYRTYFPDPPGGLQEAIRQICLATSRHAVQNNIFTLSPLPSPAVLCRPEGDVYRSRSWAAPASCDLGGPHAWSEFRRLSMASDVVHYYFPWPFADLLHCSVRPEAPAVMTYISDVVRQKLLGAVYRPLFERMLKQMRVIVANAPRYVDTSPILSRSDIRRKVEVIPLGIDEHSYPTTQDDSIFARLGLSAEEPYFLFIGVLRYYKGLSYLLEAAKHTPYKIVIAGSGPQDRQLRDHVFNSGLTNVQFAGQVSDEAKLSLLRNCLALVLPSHLRSEAFGMVLVEAAMCAKPMISCELGTGTSFVNCHMETGLVVQPASVTGLGKAMRDIGEDAAMAQSFGLAARQRYEKYFSSEALGRAYASVYRRAMAS